MLPVGNIVRTLRNERNLSQEQLAKKIGATRPTVASYELENRLPSLSALFKLSNALGVTTDYLLGVSDERSFLLDVSGLTPKQIESIDLIIENYRECNERASTDPETEI